FGAFLFMLSFITKNVYERGNFTSKATEERLDAAYERQYQYLDARPQPRYATVDLTVDLFPAERRASYAAELTLLNVATADTLFLNWKDFVEVKSLQLNGRALPQTWVDEEQQITAYSLPATVREDSLLQLSLRAEKQYTGFTQSDAQADLTYVGSMASVQDLLPIIGYAGDKELSENRQRTEQGLARLDSRMAPVTDPIGLQQDSYAPDAVAVTGSITISTPADQIPFAAGKLVSSLEENDRRTAVYQIDTPMPFNWHLGAADYAQLTGQAKDLTYTIFHKPTHTFNLELYQAALQKGIDFMQKYFGATAVTDQLQLVEVHRWQEPTYTFANTIVLSEKEGWVADTEGLQEQAYLYQTIGSGLASLWIQRQLRIANVQGADMLRKALPEAIGMQFVRTAFDDEAVELLRKKKMDKYAKDRNNEPNQEPALLYADGIDYLEVNKGAVVLYDTMEAMGWEQFQKRLLAWSAAQNTYGTFTDFLDFLGADVAREVYTQVDGQ
ncbi:MAG: hypothetical protein AAGJ82_14170, partial [Bacteroidota bacterium]